MKALSVLQPWAWLIVNGYKDIENRNWKPWNTGLKFRGPVLIHAGKAIDREAIFNLQSKISSADGSLQGIELPEEFATGGIVGEAEIVDCVTSSDSPWFTGPFGFVIRNARPVLFRPCKGQLGFFTPQFEE